MTDDAQHVRLDRVSQEVRAQSRHAYDRMVADIDSGTAPRRAMTAAFRSFEGPYYEALSRELSEILDRSVGVREVRDWPVGKVTLSRALYSHQTAVQAATLAVLREHASAMHSLRQTALELYEGYGFRAEEVLAIRQRLPRYIRRAVPVVNDIERTVARFQAAELRTPALRAAYLQALDGIEDRVTHEVRDKLLDVAWHERNRYYANRIAQTELQRAYAEQKDGAMLGDGNVEFVEWRLSGTHPETDICDLHASADLYGLGPGIYPKHLAPARPAHPFCRCILVPRYGLSGSRWRARETTGAREFLRSLPRREAAKVAGSQTKLQQLLAGQPLADVLNRGVPEGYGYRRLGEDHHRVVATAMTSGLIARGERASSGTPTERVRALFTSESSFDRHLGRRMRLGHLSSAEDYAARTLTVLSQAAVLTIAVHGGRDTLMATGKIAQDEDWVVILSARGEVVTSYRYDRDRVQFEDRHRSLGDDVYEHRISDENRRALARVFGRR